MITGTIASSILLQKAGISNIEDLYRKKGEDQFNLYKETLTDLEEYLDTEDLRKLNVTSLGLIRDDILNIIRGFRILKDKIKIGGGTSMLGALDRLRDSRDNIQDAIDFYEVGKNSKGRAELRKAQTNLAEALELLDPPKVKRKVIQ